MARVLEFGPASAIPMFPVLNRAEMRAQAGNELAAIPDSDMTAIWQGLMARLGRIPEYRLLFRLAYPTIPFNQLTFAHAANAIGGFLVSEFAFANSPWDRFLAGDNGALSPAQLVGAQTFLSTRCAQCHNGPAFSDGKFHNVAMPQVGPGGDGELGNDDQGRMDVTGNDADEYGFRTSPLRNVELTGPWGHDGVFLTLHDFVDHYSESDLKLTSFSVAKLDPLLQGTLFTDFDDVLENRDSLLTGFVMTPTVIDQITTFLTALTDPAARYLDRTIPRRVPSGLPIDR